MKRILFVLLFFATCVHIVKSQTTVIPGKPIAEIFTDFHYNINDTSKTSGFGLNRAYLGYKFQPEGNFYGTVIVNIGSPEDLSAGEVPRRYAYFREASMSYLKDNLNISFGITTTRLYDFQQKFWGKRYIANTYQSINGYGYVADIGLVIDYQFNDVVKVDFTLTNGDGYSELQLDNSLKTSIGLNITPVKQMVIRLYGDIYKPHGIMQYTLIGFAGFKNDLITIGAEVSYKSNLDIIEGHNAWGISGTGGISITKKTEIFARYDYSTSVIAPGDIIHWNYKADGSFAVYGIQYTFNQNVKMALNYQGTYPYNTGIKNTNAVYVSGLFKF